MKKKNKKIYMSNLFKINQEEGKKMTWHRYKKEKLIVNDVVKVRKKLKS
jgi:hypothetical protein